MQEEIQKISPIKQRILQYIDDKYVSKRDFYGKSAISRGTLESNTGITEDILAKFIAIHPEVSLEWLVLGKGPALKAEIGNNKLLSADDNLLLLKVIELAAENGVLKEQNRLLRKQSGYSNNNLAAE